MAKWVPARLRESTVQRLEAMRRSLLRIGIGEESYNPADPGVYLSVDALVNRLLDERDSHGRRRRASASRRKQARPTAESVPPPPDGAGPHT